MLFSKFMLSVELLFLLEDDVRNCSSPFIPTSHDYNTQDWNVQGPSARPVWSIKCNLQVIKWIEWRSRTSRRCNYRIFIMPRFARSERVRGRLAANISDTRELGLPAEAGRGYHYVRRPTRSTDNPPLKDQQMCIPYDKYLFRTQRTVTNVRNYKLPLRGLLQQIYTPLKSHLSPKRVKWFLLFRYIF